MIETCYGIDGKIKTLNDKVKTFTFNSFRNDKKFAEEIDTEVNVTNRRISAPRLN